MGRLNSVGLPIRKSSISSQDGTALRSESKPLLARLSPTRKKSLTGASFVPGLAGPVGAGDADDVDRSPPIHRPSIVGRLAVRRPIPTVNQEDEFNDDDDDDDRGRPEYLNFDSQADMDPMIRLDEKKDEPKKMSKFAAYVALVKGNVGPGCLVLPCSFANAGIAASSIAIFIVTLLAMLCPTLLVDTKNILQKHRVSALSGRPTESFDDLALHALGRNGRRVSQIMTYFLQLGICCVFLHFCAENASSMVQFYNEPNFTKPHKHNTSHHVNHSAHHNQTRKEWEAQHYEFEVKEFCVIFAVLALPISLGKSLGSLQKFTFLATMLFVVALAIIYTLTTSWAITTHLNATTIKRHRQWWPNSATDIVIAFADMAYTGSTGVALILPVENALKQKDKKHFLTIVIGALATAGLIFTGLGVGSAIVFSNTSVPLCDDDCSSITAIFERLKKNGYDICPHWVLNMLNGLLIGGVLLTFPLQLFPAAAGIEKSLKKMWLRDGQRGVSPSPRKTWDESGAKTTMTPSPEKSPGKFRSINDDNDRKLLLEDDWDEARRKTMVQRRGNRIRQDSSLLPEPEWEPWKSRMVRVSLVMFVTLAAAFFPDLTGLMAFVGCTTSAVLAMLLPAWMNFVVRRRYKVPMGVPRWLMFIILNLVGIFTLTVGNYFAVVKLAQSLRPPVPDPGPNMTMPLEHSYSGYHPGSPWWSAPSADVGSWDWHVDVTDDHFLDDAFGPAAQGFSTAH